MSHMLQRVANDWRVGPAYVVLQHIVTYLVNAHCATVQSVCWSRMLARPACAANTIHVAITTQELLLSCRPCRPFASYTTQFTAQQQTAVHRHTIARDGGLLTQLPALLLAGELAGWLTALPPPTAMLLLVFGAGAGDAPTELPPPTPAFGTGLSGGGFAPTLLPPPTPPDVCVVVLLPLPVLLACCISALEGPLARPALCGSSRTSVRVLPAVA